MIVISKKKEVAKDKNNVILACSLMVILLWSIPACSKKEATNPNSGQKVATQTEVHDHQMFHCPMHPTYTSPKMGECPICGMNLVPIPETSTGQTTSNTGTKGLAAVTISPDNSQRLGLTFGTVELSHLTREIRTSARLAVDETRQVRVTSRIEGWVEKLHVNVTGQLVKKGAPLLSIYSPELVEAQQELLTAVSMIKEFKGNDYEMLARQGQNLLNASRQRLKLWEITDKQIDQIEKSGQTQRTLTLFAPASGVVSEKMVLPGQKIMPGESLMLITDLSHLWGLADIYEADMSHVKIGTTLEITLPNLPERTFAGKIVFLDPALDPMTRTIKARLEINNQDYFLKPEMYADARLKIDLGEKLTIPGSAVMRGGDRDYVFVAGKDGQLQPVEVKIGTRSGDIFELITGLYEGDKVVTSANFLIDSESSLKAALQAVINSK